MANYPDELATGVAKGIIPGGNNLDFLKKFDPQGMLDALKSFLGLSANAAVGPRPNAPEQDRRQYYNQMAGEGAGVVPPIGGGMLDTQLPFINSDERRLQPVNTQLPEPEGEFPGLGKFLQEKKAQPRYPVGKKKPSK